ncbi:MAG: division/cell wall cluster transcriptional repressor MraZ [Xanthobacteraceae bacterium]
MDLFVANYTGRLDAKGRVSIPAPFRAVLNRDGFTGLYCYPSLDRPAIDAGGHGLLAEIDGLIGRYAPYSEEREELLVALYGRSETLKVDSEGRIVLSEMLKTHAGIGEAATFVGLGHRFQIWEPERFRAQLDKATDAVRTLTRTLGSPRGAAPEVTSGHGARE